MCTGLEIGLMAASAAGQAITAYEQQRYANQQAKVANKELERFLDRNKAREDEAQGILAARKTDAAPEQAQPAREQAATDRTQVMQSAIDNANVAAPIPTRSSAESLIGDVYRSEADKATASASDRARALGVTTGFGDALFNQGLGNADAGRKLGTIGAMAGDDAGLLSTYQDLARARVKPPMGIGGMISGIAGAYGMKRGAYG